MRQKNDELFKHEEAIRISLNVLPSTEAKLEKAKSNEASPTEAAMVFWFSLIFVLCGIAICNLISEILTIVRKKLVVIQKRVEEVPCENCRFFSNNPYLKCTVHPSIVLTKEAIHCPDYRFKDSKTFY